MAMREPPFSTSGKGQSVWIIVPMHCLISASIQGQVPKDLKGTLLRNGPGNFNFGGWQHPPLDGDGAESAGSRIMNKDLSAQTGIGVLWAAVNTS